MADRSLYSETSSPMPTGLDFLDQYGDRLKQLFDAAIWPLSSVGGTGNAVTASCDPPVIGALVEHMRFAITWAADNTGGMTLSIGGATAVPVLTADGSAMQAGDAVTGTRVMLEYVGGAFRLIGGSASSGAAAGPYDITITTSGTWVKPTGYADDTPVILEAWGGGGGGARTAAASAGGGGGGGYARREMRYADVPTSLSNIVGAGGAGRTGSTGNGSIGTATSIGSLLVARPGGGGEGSGSGTAVGGGGGGELTAGNSSGIGGKIGGGASNTDAGTIWGGGGGGGGNAGTGSDGGRAVFGGGGGGGGSATGSLGGESLHGGNGGNGGDASPAPTAGIAPGGGGGGGYNSTNGANGARGEIRIRILG